MDKLLEDLENKIVNVQFNYRIELGVIDETTDRKDTASFGITNAQLMYIHENGGVNLPRRPVLQKTIDWANKNIVQQTIEYCIDNIVNNNWTRKDITKELTKMCHRIERYARKLIKDGKELEPLKHRDGIPLLDTGQLMRSITCRLIED